MFKRNLICGNDWEEIHKKTLLVKNTFGGCKDMTINGLSISITVLLGYIFQVQDMSFGSRTGPQIYILRKFVKISSFC